MKIYIHTYDENGKSYKKILQLEGNSPIASRDSDDFSLIINWGSSRNPSRALTRNCIWLNSPNSVRTAVDKQNAYNVLKYYGHPTIEYTAKKEEANTWLNNGDIVIERLLTSSGGGAGICVKKPGDVLDSCKLYTKYIPNTREIRVHCTRSFPEDRFLSHQKRKVLNYSGERSLPQVKIVGKGWTYSKRIDDDISDLLSFLEARAVICLAAMKLDFGAVDFLILPSGECRILEINTAPGLDGPTTTNFYLNYFKQYYNETI